jgi:hypothetical protein
MDGESPVAQATIKQALYWTKIYTEIVTMEEKVLRRIKQLMALQSPEARREAELTNVPVIAAQAERFRKRLGYWNARVLELHGAGDGQKPKRVVKESTAEGEGSVMTGSPDGAGSRARRRTVTRRPGR